MKKFKQGDPVLWHGDYRVYEVVDRNYNGMIVLGDFDGESDAFYEYPEKLTPIPEPYVLDANGRPIRVGQLVESVAQPWKIRRVEEIREGPLVKLEGQTGWTAAKFYRTVWETYSPPEQPETDSHEFKVALTVPRDDRWSRETWQEQLRLLVDQTWGTDMGEGTVMTVTVEPVDE